MDLTKAVNEILIKYVDDCEKGLLGIEEQVAKEAVKKLNRTSPMNPRSKGHKGKHYNKDWYVDTKNKKHYDHIIIANHQYQLTHLLEKGHNVVRGGKVVGHTKAEPHIKPVEEWAKNEVVARAELWLGMAKKSDHQVTVIDIGGKS